jgi:hypothetical protein
MDMNTILAAFNKITSESMGMAGGSHTAMDSGKKCSSCGNRIEGSGKTTERGDVICADCDQHYAFGGPGEHEVKEAAGKQGAKGFKFPGKGRYGYKYGTGPGVGYAGGTAAGTPLLIYDKQTGETIDIPDFTYFDEDPDQYDLAELANDAKEYSVNKAASKQGAKGFKFPGKGRYGYKYGTGPGVGYAGGTAAGTPLLIYDKQTGKTIDIPDFTYFDEDPDQYDLAELANDAKEYSVNEGSDMEPRYGYEFPEGGRYGYKYDDDVDSVTFANGTANTQPLLVYDKQTGKTLSIPDFTYFDEDPDQDMLAELVFYSDETPVNYSVNEGQCSNCGADPCVCESMSEGFGTTMRKYVPGLGKMTAKRRAEKAEQASSDAIDRAMDKPFDDIEGRKSDEQEFYTQGKRKDRYSKIADGMSEGFRRELGDIQRLAECGEMYMPMQVQAQATSGMNVTTNVDSKTGTKTVTVSADGAGAEELMRVLANAGIAVAPMMSDMHQGMAEEVANHPAPQTLDTQTVMNQGEDLNRIKWQGNVDRARDNSMTFNEDVANLANSLRRQFMESKNSNKFDTWTIKTGGITYTLKELKKMGADASFIQDDADDPDEYAETPYVMDKNTQKPLIIKSKAIRWTSFKDPNPEEDND